MLASVTARPGFNCHTQSSYCQGGFGFPGSGRWKRGNGVVGVDMKKVINDLMREAKRQGAEVSLTRNGHWRVRLPSGKVIFAPQSPSDYQSTCSPEIAPGRS